MTNTKDDKTKKQSDIIKEGTEEFLDEQKQQMENTTSTISETTDKVTDNINEYQETNKEILEESMDTTNNYQQEMINSIQSISNNYIELQKNLLNTFYSVVSKFFDDTSNKSYWNNFKFPERYNTSLYNKTNQNVTNNTVNTTLRLNEFLCASTETFNKSIEIAQKCYNESVQNYFNFINKIGKSYYSNQ
jgi:sugar-specific transcriptional regulator TrmB